MTLARRATTPQPALPRPSLNDSRRLFSEPRITTTAPKMTQPLKRYAGNGNGNNNNNNGKNQTNHRMLPYSMLPFFLAPATPPPIQLDFSISPSQLYYYCYFKWRSRKSRPHMLLYTCCCTINYHVAFVLQERSPFSEMPPLPLRRLGEGGCLLIIMNVSYQIKKLCNTNIA